MFISNNAEVSAETQKPLIKDTLVMVMISD